MVPLDLKVVNQFLLVAEELSFRKAAERLHMSQPPLSVSIRQLEESLGFLLFHRKSTGVTLTPAGAVFQAECIKLTQHARRAVHAATEVAMGRAGTIRIAFISSAMIDLLPRVMVGFTRAHPEVTLKLTEAVSLEGLRLVERGEVDIALASPPLGVLDSLVSEPISNDSLVAVLPDSHQLAPRLDLSMQELRNESFVSFSEDRVPGFRQRIMAACLQSGYEPRIVQEASQLHTLLALVAAGLGIALLPSVMSRIGHAGVVFKAINPKLAVLETHIDAIYNPADSNLLVSAFLNELRATS